MNNPELLLLLPLWYVVFLLSLTCHEAAHAFAARLGGDDTAYLGGQVSLNPLPHVRREPMGAVVIPFLTFLYTGGGWMMGWASAPYDPLWEDRHPRRAAMMALAGPLANLLLVVLAFALLRIGIVTGVWGYPFEQFAIDRLVVPVAETAGVMEAVGRLASIMLFLNLVLFLFNLIPLPPLDGASIVSGLFEPARRMRDALRASSLGAMAGLVGAWLVFPYVFRPIWRWVFGLLHA